MLPEPLTTANPALHHVAFVVADLDVALEGQQRIGFHDHERFTLQEQGVEGVEALGVNRFHKEAAKPVVGMIRPDVGHSALLYDFDPHFSGLPA